MRRIRGVKWPVDWDDKGHATINLSRALDSDEDDSEADDSDDEHMSDDSDDDSIIELADDSDDDSHSEPNSFCEVCDEMCTNVTWYIHPHSYHPQGRNLYSACPECAERHSISGVVGLYTGWD